MKICKLQDSKLFFETPSIKQSCISISNCFSFDVNCSRPMGVWKESEISIEHSKQAFSVKSRAHHNLPPSNEISVIGIMINLVISAFLKRYETRSFMISNYLT